MTAHPCGLSNLPGAVDIAQTPHPFRADLNLLEPSGREAINSAWPGDAL